MLSKSIKLNQAFGRSGLDPAEAVDDMVVVPHDRLDDVWDLRKHGEPVSVTRTPLCKLNSD